MKELFSVIYTDFQSGWSRKEWLWLFVAIAAVVTGSISASPLEFWAGIFNVVCVILVAKGRLSNYYWGLLGVVLYAIVSYKQQLYGNMALNVIYFGFQFWGIYEWRKTLLNKTDAGVDVSVKRLSLLQFLQMTFVVLAGTFAVSLFLRHIGDSSPVLDAFTMVASLIAMGLMVKQYSEQWLLWILVDIASIYMWVIPALDQPGSWSMVAMWTVITGNALYGAYMWFIVKINK